MDSLWEDVSSCSSQNGDIVNDCKSEASTISSFSGVYSDLSDFDFDILDEEVAANQDKQSEYMSVAFEEVGSSPEPNWTICDSSPSPEVAFADNEPNSELQMVLDHANCPTYSLLTNPSKSSNASLLQDVSDVRMETPTSFTVEADTSDFECRKGCPLQNATCQEPPLMTEMWRQPVDDHGVSNSDSAPCEASSADDTTVSYEDCYAPNSSEDGNLHQHKQMKHSPVYRKLTYSEKLNDEMVRNTRTEETFCHYPKSYTYARDMDYRIGTFASGDAIATTSQRNDRKRVRSCLKEFGASVAGEYFDVMRLHSWTTREELEQAVEDHMDFVMRLRIQQKDDGPHSPEAALQQLRNLGVTIPGGNNQPS